MEKIDRIVGFLMINYCQNCKTNYNKKCNVGKFQKKYKTNELNLNQASEVNLFLFDFKENKCINYEKPKDLVLIHTVEIYFKDKEN